MVTHYLKQMLDKAHSLLGAARENCFACGKSAPLNREFAGICDACARVIPWIVHPRCLACGRAIGCPDCSRTGLNERAFVMNRSAVMYNGLMREWLAQYKYRGNERYAGLLAGMLARAYALMERELSPEGRARHLRGGQVSGWLFHAVTSVPVSEVRLQERGFNQAEAMATGLARKIKVPYLRLLQRKRHTDKQSFKTRMDRMRDMQDAFVTVPHAIELMFRISAAAEKRMNMVLDRSNALLPLRLLLIDDIYTTGSTVHACAEALRKHEKALGQPIEVYCLTWARS
ncbi:MULTISPECIES: ComF family protein [Paenibacillus]|uniref:ComF family protein n=1 Tax=Paenibacillus TaxID=44249 RepID=UPI0011A6229F|nr:ComF family protein [Paenibacillus sp. IHBB 10380]